MKGVEMMKKFKVASVILLAVSVILLVLSFLPSYSETEIYDKILRLHVLANSDSKQDQELKLKVRDAVLELSHSFDGDFQGIDGAEKLYSEKLNDIKAVAERVVKENGYSYPVSVSLEREHYPVRSYDDFTLPAGNYLSLKINIGEAKGQNWWCVLYPPLCLSAANADEELIEAGFTGDQIKIITKNNSSAKYKIKFKLVESFKGFFDKIFD